MKKNSQIAAAGSDTPVCNLMSRGLSALTNRYISAEANTEVSKMATLKTASTTRSLRAVAIAAVIGLVLSLLVTTPQARADQNGQVVSVWSINGGITPNPKVWKFRQSCFWNNNQPQVQCESPIGSATAASPSLNDTGWRTVAPLAAGHPVVNDISTGPNVANHYRKSFTLAETGVDPYKIIGMRFSVFYDDTTVVYLNGKEVYRSIRGNLDPTYANYPKHSNIPYNVPIPYGGYENYYVEVPNYLNENSCEQDFHCTTSPYGGPNPPEVPLSYFDSNGDGVIEADEPQLWSVTVWNRQASVDTSFDFTFDLVVDPTATPPKQVQINEVMASNNTSWQVNTDDDPELESPDWIELHNFSNTAADLTGWTLSDSAASYTFGSVSIPAGGYLLVAANDCVVSATQSCTNPIQTNFKVSSEGESLKLVRNTGVLEDEYAAMPRQLTDVSFGRANDSGQPGFLNSPTPGGPNSALGSNYKPVLRLFADRIYNVGETVDLKLDAFSPDNQTLNYSISNLPTGLSLDSATGRITGTASQVGSWVSMATVSDPDGSVTQNVNWLFVKAAAGGSPIILNEYNAVRSTSEMVGGNAPVGNYGDWFEFLVVEDNLDLRGYTIELWDRKGVDSQLRLANSLTFANKPELRMIPAGTLILIQQGVSDDLSFDGNTDWTIRLGVDGNGNGNFFEANLPTERFNSTRASQMVLIRNASGAVVTPLSGETKAWDDANGGVSGQEVMNYCANPQPGVEINPITQYRDNGMISTIGQPNKCRHVEPIDPNNPAAGSTNISFDQDLSALRSSASMGRGSGDVDCDGNMTILDARIITQYSVGLVQANGSCLFTNGAGINFIEGGDMNKDGTVNIVDARMIAQCVVGLVNEGCPAN